MGFVDGESPTTQTKVSDGLTKLFTSSLKRSRSLVGIGRSPSSDHLRSNTALGFQSREDLPTRKSSLRVKDSIAEEREQERAHSPVSTGSISPVTPPIRPKPAPSLWEDSEMDMNSLPGLETAIAPNHIHHSPLSMNPPTAPFATNGPAPSSPLAKNSPRTRDRSLSRRRKDGVSDLALEGLSNPMTTVQECIMDSPTIPGQFPRAKRTPRASPGSNLASRECLTPRAVASDPQLAETRQEMEPLDTPTWKERGHKRASSMLLPVSLAPLVIPVTSPIVLPEGRFIPSPEPAKLSPRPSPVVTEFMASPPPESASPNVSPLEELPPRVPPKSPRTLYRAFPARHAPLPPLQPFTFSHTASSSVTSINSLETPMTATSLRQWSPLAQIPSPRMQQSARDVGQEMADMTSPLPWKMKEYHGHAPHPGHVRGNYSIDERSTRKPFYLMKSASSQCLHQRVSSEGSVMNRGRPYAKRPDRAEISPVQRGINATVRVALFTGTFRELPTGYKKPQVANALPKEELHSLRRTAEYQAASFETLRESQLEELNHELDLLNQNCEQLKQTILGLKDGRKNQQNKMRAFLHSPGNAMVSREHLIKQESALSGVESQIDDWTLKLEKAQDRRFSVQQKILEHTAAVLNVRLPVSEGGARLSEEQTPPRSPERLAMGSEWESQLERERRDVESIRVYADSGVASLLRDIEQEIDLMDRSITMSP